MKKHFLIAFLIAITALFFRTYRLVELTKFGFDEARDAAVEREMIVNRKLTLLGPETKIGDKTIFFGPLHYYLMVPALKVTNFDPLGPNLWTALLGSVTAVLIFTLTKSASSGIVYAVFPIAIIYNRWAWNPNTIPLFATLFFWSLLSHRYVLSGFFWGLTLQLHLTSFGLVIFLLPSLFHKSRSRLSVLSRILFGLFIGLLPILVFDLRHDWLNLKAIFGLLTANFAYRGFNLHYFLWIIPAFCLWVKSWNWKATWFLVLVSATYSFIWLYSQPVNLAQNPKTIKTVADIIANDQKKSPDLPFNIASFVDPDTRATAYRYFLSLQGLFAKGVGEYDVVDHLFVVTFDDKASVLYNQTYEIASFRPQTVSSSWRVGDENVLRLERNRL